MDRSNYGQAGGGQRFLNQNLAYPPAGGVDPDTTLVVDAAGPTSTRSPLTDTFPVFQNITTAVGQLPRPTSAVFGSSMAVFPLMNLDVYRLYNQDVLLTGIHATLSSTGNTDTQGFSAWGDARGWLAAVVVGRNLRGLKPASGLDSSWQPMVLPVPWVDPALPALSPGLAIESKSLIWSSPFAPGNLSTAPSRVDPAEDFPPHVERFRKSDRLQVAFVLNGAQANSAVPGQSGVFRCLINIRIRLGMTVTQRGLTA